MGSQSLLDRAKEVIRGKGILTALAIAPLAMSVPVKADSVVFATPLMGISTPSGGAFGHIGQSLFANSNGVFLNGDTNVTHLGVAPYFSYSGYLKAEQAAFNNGHVTFDWGLDYDHFTPQPSLSNHISIGDRLNIMRNFNVSVIPADSLVSSVPVSWTLKAKIVTTAETLEYIVDSSSGSTMDLGTQFFHADGEALSWSVALDFDWQLTLDKSGQLPVVTGSNPGDRLQIDFGSSAAPMFISIDQNAAAEGVPAPLPSTAWMCGALLGLVGVARLRKSGSLTRIAH